MEVREMPKRLSNKLMTLAEEIYNKQTNLSEQEYIDVYSNAYVLGYDEAWNKHCKKKKLTNSKPTDYAINCSAIEFYVKHRDRVENDIKNMHDAFQFGFLSGYMLCWNCMEEVRHNGLN